MPSENKNNEKMSNLTHLTLTDTISSSNTTLLPSQYNRRLDGTPEVKFCYLYDFLIEAVFMGILCLFGFAGNTLSFLVLWREKSKYATPFLLMTLAVADTMFLSTVMILRVLTSIYTYTRTVDAVSMRFPYIVNYVFPFAQMSLTGTVWLTVLVTLNRYISVCKPYEVSQLCSKSQARKHVAGVTLFSVIYSMPKFFEYYIGEKFNPRQGHWVYHAWPTRMAQNTLYRIIYSNLIYCLVVYILPLLILITLNYKLAKTLSHARRRRRQLLNQRRNNTQSQEEDVTFTLIIVVVVFVVAQTPALVTQSFQAILSPRQRICPTYYFFYSRISDLLVVINSSANFLIYCFCSRKFRNILRLLMCVHSTIENRDASESPNNAPGQGINAHCLRLTEAENTKSSRSSIKYGDLNNHTAESEEGVNGVARV